MASLEIVLLPRSPSVMLASPAQRRDLGNLVRAAMAMIFAGALYRFDTLPGRVHARRALVATSRACPRCSSPSASSRSRSSRYIVIVKTFPILSGHMPAERQAV